MLRTAKSFIALNLIMAPLPLTAGDDVPGPAEAAAAQLVRGNTNDAIAGYTEALKDVGLANDRRATILNDRAVAYGRSAQVKLALDDFNRAIQLFPENPATYNNRGNVLVSAGQPGEAIKDYDRALVLSPNYAAAFSNRANAHLRLGHPAEAIRDFTRAVELLPTSAAPLSGRGLAHLASGRPHAAIRDFSRAVVADARFAAAYRNRAEARIATDQPEDAVEDLSRAIAFDGANAELYVARGYAYLARDNPAAAITDFTRATELDPKDAAGFRARGLAHATQQAYEDALPDLNRALELDGRSAIGLAFRAYAYKGAGQLEVADRDIETAWKIDATAPEVLWAKAELEDARGETDAAAGHARQAIDLKPSWLLAARLLERVSPDGGARNDSEVAGAGIDSWRVVMRGARYFAISEDYPKIRMPLEMMGEGQPRLIEWDMRKAPHKGYGVLRFSSGTVTGKTGAAEETEMAAIVDLVQDKVIAIQPNRQGAKVANWTWEDDRVQIASIDGVTDEVALRAEKARDGSYVARRQGGAAPRGARWSPWGDDVGLPQTGYREAARPPRRSKPKSFFEMLFN